jgi:hypothetical protein
VRRRCKRAAPQQIRAEAVCGAFNGGWFLSNVELGALGTAPRPDTRWQRILEVKVQSNLNNRMGVGFLAGLLALAISAAVSVPVQAQDSGDRPVLDFGIKGPPEAYAAAETPAALPGPATKANAKASGKAAQASGKRLGSGKDAGKPYIEFRSRYALSYGHTFVVFGRLNARGEVGEIKPEMVAGLHPAGQGSELWTLGHVVFVPAETGWSDGDLEEQYVSNRFRVMLSEEQFAKLVAHIRHKQKNSPMWHAALYNCNLWTGEIAQYLGLKTGFHWLPPAEYIQKIKDMNSPAAQAAAAWSSAPAAQGDGGIVR